MSSYPVTLIQETDLNAARKVFDSLYPTSRWVTPQRVFELVGA